MKAIAIVGFVFVGLGGVVGLSMLPDIIHHINYYGQEIAGPLQ